MKSRGIGNWCYVNNLDKRYEQWKVEMTLSKEENAKLKAIGIKTKTIVDDDDNITYKYTFTRKLARKGKKGGQNQKPDCVDSQGNPFDGLIGNGSEVIVVHKPYAWEFKGKSGVGTDLCGVQIVDLIPYETDGDGGSGDGTKSLDDGDDGFEKLEGGFVAKEADKKADTGVGDLDF